MIYILAYLNTLLLLHSVYVLFAVKMPLKGEVGGCALKVMELTLLIMENHGIMFLNFCGNPAGLIRVYTVCYFSTIFLNTSLGPQRDFHV